ncbi:Protein transport protein YIP1 [Dictyocoela muelleri]|nr:Protein transport protein YIP1 [Dictyocoela muelleri]
MNLNDYSEFPLVEFNLKSALTGSLPTDPPLLEELGINFSTIKRESQIIFFKPVIEPRDLSGPLMFIITFCILSLVQAVIFSEKLVFGYVYFNSIFMSIFVYAILNLLCNDEFVKTERRKVHKDYEGNTNSINTNGINTNSINTNSFNTINSNGINVNFINNSIDLLAVISVIGYSFMPIIILQLISICIKLISFYIYKRIKIPLSLIFILWSSYCSTNNFYFILNVRDKFYLIFYPLFLCYSVFAMIGIY